MKFPKSSIGLDDNILTSVGPTALWCVRSMLCTNAGPRPWAGIKMPVIVAAKSGSATTVAAIATALNVSQTNRHFGSKTA